MVMYTIKNMMNNLIRTFVIIIFCFIQNNAYSQARQKLDRNVIQQMLKKPTITSPRTSSKNKTTSNRKTQKKKNVVQKTVARKRVSTYLDVSEVYVYFGSDGGYRRISVDSNSPWEISLDTYGWAHVSKDGYGVDLRAESNLSQTPRNDYFILRAGSVEKRINIYQSGASSIVNSLYGTSRAFADNATGLPHLTEKMKSWQECKCGAITSTGMGIVVYGRNGYASYKIYSLLSSTLKACNNDNLEIKAVALTNSGYYCFIYDRNGWYGNVPNAMEQKLNEFKNSREEILSISISENGDFAIVTDKHFLASNSSDNSTMKSAHEKFGMIKNVCVTNRGICVVCSNGIYYNNIPENLERKLKEIEFKPSFITFTDEGTYLITDGSKGFTYRM